jgi:hypothetical protein
MTKFRKILLKYVLPFSLVMVCGFYIYDTQKLSELPRFRRSDDPFLTSATEPLPSRKGLDALNISGSRRPTQKGLLKQLGGINMPVYSFDLQEEGHYFINGSPEQWYGYKRIDQVGVDGDKVRPRHYIRRLIHTGKLSHDASDVQNEKQMTEEIGFHYVGICQTRHRIPIAEQVDQFIDTLDNIPQPAWIHFHCNAGRSRTTIAMIMFDMMRNGKDVSLNDIVYRHHFLGSEDLFDTNVWNRGSTYTKERLESRKAFVENFYRYVNDPEGYGVTKWSDWAAKHKVYADGVH